MKNRATPMFIGSRDLAREGTVGTRDVPVVKILVSFNVVEMSIFSLSLKQLSVLVIPDAVCQF